MSGSSLYQAALAHLMNSATPPKPMSLRPSASIVLWRTGDDGRTEVFWVRRNPALGVLGGWRAFPGGGVSKNDVDLPLVGQPTVSQDAHFPRYDIQNIDPDLSHAVIAAGLRELWEETGILITHPPVDPARQLDLEPLRSGGENVLAEWLRLNNAALDANRLVFAGRWITPPISAFRFDTRFFLLEWTQAESVQPKVDGGELCEGDWIAAEDALDQWKARQALAAPPTVYMLEILASHGPKQGLQKLVRHGDEEIHPNRRFLEARPGIIAIPLLTPTLPPARETISYLVGRDRVALVDVGSPFDSEIDRLILLLETLKTDFGKTLAEIWLTHHHPDHIWGVERIRQRFGIPVRAHSLTAEKVASAGLKVDRTIDDEEILDLGGENPMPIRAMHTPGHAAGHLVFVEPQHGSVIAGDLVAGLGTIMIDPDEGDMGDYMASLERVGRLEPRTLFPSHGPVIADATSRLAELLEHRRHREQLIENLWNQGIREIDTLVKQVYTDVSPSMHPFAARQAQAHLIKLTKEGKITGSL
jgi:glyoxylase-like metal-dependent hydrolase (beta-lactamase superfamily II)/8-oxo-dGTP pyrophosphatase MutT (NUDIX family)